MIHPHRCRVEEGGCHAQDWVHAHCAKPHIIYLAYSSQPKVGITCITKVPTRWIDQGAIQALPIMRVENRYLAGLIEMKLKLFISDKTNWRALLKKQTQEKNELIEIRDRLWIQAESVLSDVLSHYRHSISFLLKEQVVTIQYPVNVYPDEIILLNFNKHPKIEGRLMGIKGQYLILDTGVICLRKFSGYEIIIEMP